MEYDRSDAKGAARDAFVGLWAATTTPFDADGRMDLDAAAADLARLVEGLEVDGIFCSGVMSEFWALSTAERLRQVEAVVGAVRGRCPVIAHTGHHSVVETIELTRHAERAGADFAVVLRPYYPVAADDGIYDFYSAVCGAVDIGVWIFDTAYAGPPLSLDLVDRLADIENVCGIKVGHPRPHYLAVLQRVADRILVCAPAEQDLLADIRDHGQRVHMPSAAPYLYQTPEWRPMLEYTRAALSGDFAEAAEVAATLDPCARWRRSGCTVAGIESACTRFPGSRPGQACSGCPVAPCARHCAPRAPTRSPRSAATWRARACSEPAGSRGADGQPALRQRSRTAEEPNSRGAEQPRSRTGEEPQRSRRVGRRRIRLRASCLRAQRRDTRDAVATAATASGHNAQMPVESWTEKAASTTRAAPAASARRCVACGAGVLEAAWRAGRSATRCSSSRR